MGLPFPPRAVLSGETTKQGGKKESELSSFLLPFSLSFLPMCVCVCSRAGGEGGEKENLISGLAYLPFFPPPLQVMEDEGRRERRGKESKSISQALPSSSSSSLPTHARLKTLLTSLSFELPHLYLALEWREGHNILGSLPSRSSSLALDDI